MGVVHGREGETVEWSASKEGRAYVQGLEDVASDAAQIESEEVHLGCVRV